MIKPFGTDWTNWSKLIYVNPTNFFDIDDNEAPEIEAKFHFFKNETDEIIGVNKEKILSGNVDIVAGLKDKGEFARSQIHSKGGRYSGDRLAISRLNMKFRELM